MATTQQKQAAGGGAAAALVLLLLALGLSGGQAKPPPKTITTTTVARPTTTTTIPPTTPDGTDAFVAAVAAGDVTVDRPLRIDKIAKITTSNRTITFTGNGKLVRTTTVNPTGDNVTFPVLRLVGVSNVTIVNPQIVGPGGVCNVPRPNNAGPPFRALYDARYEESAGIALDGATDVTITGGTIRDVRGDGVRLFYDPTPNAGARPSARVSITDLTTTCVGRAAITNISSDSVTVTRGNFTLSGYWTFNVEPFNTQAVTNYLIDRPTIGYSTSAWLFAGGGRSPSCKVQMRAVKPVAVELVNSAVITDCVRPTVVADLPTLVNR